MSQTAQSERAAVESLTARVVDDFLARQKRGERPTPEEYAARHPELAAVLHEVLAALRLAGLSGGCSTDESLAGVLGDFRIVGEAGRGGMGVVYEAVQISLNRRVALKVLPFAATMDPRRLQRFHNEARAAACLHHPHIVPVHGVGQERGVHFYAMQFIEGMSLADLLARLREPDGDDPTPTATTRPAAGLATDGTAGDVAELRQVAEWGVQAAEALEHAHSLGIVHRDVKPGNLMIDGRGHLWVTDFGLAQTADGGLTLTGDLVGTLRYMSPEQALAKHGLVDHRTDVYSLGVTLYELLTRQPAVAGAGREEVLRNLAFAEPRRPRAVNRRVPVDLETVVLKAMAREPGDRYASAKDLADDLRRWLEDRPIEARRPNIAQQLSRLARRHRAVVTTAAAGVVAAAAVLGGSIGWMASERQSRRAETGRVVGAALEDAREALGKNKPYEALSAALRADGLLRQAGGYPEIEPRAEAMLWDIRLLLRLELARLSPLLGGPLG